ncbi:hypothetical protein OM33_05785 [Pseudoalteromonas piratica]|uniref:Uncharacterized protein n=1 Tax=Pseudoalteromonas piratica TaxID=1348114 RepID=A0A0A7EDV3_9GAMM|nr:hypothetical protein OM33_05785 [Pseudoalteromonas piratica]
MGEYSKAKNFISIVKKFYSWISKYNDTGYFLGISRDPVISIVSQRFRLQFKIGIRPFFDTGFLTLIYAN